MIMDKQEEKTYSSQAARIRQSAAYGLGIVPAEPTSSSDNGLSSTLPTSVEPENAFAEETCADVEPANEEKKIELEEANTNIPPAAPNAGETNICSVDRSHLTISEKDIETTTVVKDESMECEEHRASKRKKSHSEIQSSDSDEDMTLRKVKVIRKRNVIDDEGNLTCISKALSKSNPDLSQRPSEEDPRITKMKKGYISKQKGLEIEEMKETIAQEKRDEIKRKKEEKIKAEEEAKKKEDRNKAVVNVMAKIGAKPAIEREFIENMTASNLAAMALEYLDHIDIIRLKCGTMQGALSGELKKRKASLDNMVRALQVKAEEKGDPHFLRAKIEDLIKKNREEEERKKREISELKETVANLSKENKDMRREVNLLRKSIERRNSLERSYRDRYPNGGKEDRNTYPTDESHDVPRCPTTSRDVPRGPMTSFEDMGPVMRPSLGGRMVPIPNSNLKQKDMINIKEIGKGNKTKEGKDGKGKPVIRVIENIQLKPPRKEEVKVKVRDENVDVDMETNMDWDDNGTSWNETGEIVAKTEKEEISLEKEKDEVISEKEKKKQEGTWTEVVKKGRKRDNRNPPATSTARNKPILLKEVKRKMPKTAAISIKGDVKQGFSYAEVLRKARSQIKIEELQIEAPRIRKGLNGATIIEISGPDCNEKAQLLAGKLQEVLKEDKAAVTTPMIRGELRLTGLDESIGKDEIGWTIEEEGGCGSKNIRIGEIRKTRSGMGVVWVQCPLKSAIEIAKKKKIKIGWTIVGVTLLQARPLQCFRCWHHGHVKDQCRSKIDRSKNCFRCGKEGHSAATCNNKIQCAICTDLGRDNAHRVGSAKCEGVKAKAIEKKPDSERRTEEVMVE